MAIFRFNPSEITAPLTAAAESFLAADQNTPGVVVRVSSSSLTAGVASGLADLDTGAAAQPNASFESGSQTKMMTAVVILQLAEAGQVDLDARITDYLPASVTEGIANADQATLREVLAMRSGIPDYLSVPDENGVSKFLTDAAGDPSRIYGAADALDLIRGLPADFVPDAAYNYSNTGYLLLGKIIEAITDQTIDQVLGERIFTPLNMTESHASKFEAGADLKSYIVTPDGLVDTLPLNVDFGWEGGVVSTTADLTQFMRGLLVSKSLLSDESLSQMMATYSDLSPPDSDQSFGFGFGLGIYSDSNLGECYYYTGETFGSISTTFYVPSQDLVISVAGDSNAQYTDLLAIAVAQASAVDPTWDRFDFIPEQDVISIEQVAAADLAIDASGGVTLSANSVALSLDSSLGSLTTSNITFTDGSVLVIGDNQLGSKGDQKSNSIDISRQFSAASDQDNQIWGLGGDDRLLGGNGSDLILGGSGADRLDGGNGDDRLLGESGRDSLLGGQGNDQLEGGEGRDIIKGGDGNDVLIGGIGGDRLSGGAGADRFVLMDIGESFGDGKARDTVLDFSTAEGDLIDLSNIDAVSGGSDDAFTLVTAFTGQAGELMISRDRGGYLVQGDLDGDHRADFSILVNVQGVLTASDFVF